VAGAEIPKAVTIGPERLSAWCAAVSRLGGIAVIMAPSRRAFSGISSRCNAG
jgi:hypothetical protein